MPHPKVILASASPRRKELLSIIFNEYDVIPSGYDESLVPDTLGPAEHVAYSSRMKARDVAVRFPDAIVIGADTIVTIDDAILGKPKDAADAANMLRRLSGRTHQVYTGIAIELGGVLRGAVECTDVTFRDLDEAMVESYVASEEPMDKAGAYAIQGKGSLLVKSIYGCYFNVVGLPVYRLSRLLEELGLSPMKTQ